MDQWMGIDRLRRKTPRPEENRIDPATFLLSQDRQDTHTATRHTKTKKLAFPEKQTDLLRAGDGAGALERGEPLLLGDGLHHLGALAALLGSGLHQPSRPGEGALQGVHEVSVVLVAGNRHLG